jgi:hypothetical protein
MKEILGSVFIFLGFGLIIQHSSDWWQLGGCIALVYGLNLFVDGKIESSKE